MNPYQYRVEIHAPEHHLFRVRLNVPANGEPETSLLAPAWIPGSYKIRDYSRHIIEFDAEAEGRPLSWRKTDKQRWRVANQGRAFSVHYLVYAFDLSVRGAHLNEQHAYFNGVALFLYPEDPAERACELELAPLPAACDWRVFTSLPSLAIDPQGFGRYRAESYRHLIDCPVEIGEPEVLLFEVRGIPHRLVVSGRHFGDLKAIGQALKAICEQHCALFGELPLAEQYLFLLQLVGEGYGGLEHRDSTSLLCRRTSLECPDPAKPGEDYRQFLALCSHEYFHLWNGKRICPEAYRAPELDREVHSELLWLVEGVTSYYDELALVRAKVIGETDYLDMLAKNLTRHFKGKGRLRQSVAESSFDAWTRFYQQDENAPNAIVSYYTKGGIVVLLLDLWLRRASGGAQSFDQVMRHLWQHHGASASGLDEEAMPAIIHRATGIDLTAQLHAWLHTTQAIDQALAELLGELGIGFALRHPRGQQDAGGLRQEAQSAPAPWLGISYQPHPLGVEVRQVFEDGPAARAAIAPGDLLLALGGFRLGADNLDRLAANLAPAGQALVHLFRGDELLTRELRLGQEPPWVAELWLEPGAQPEQLRRRAQWLHRD